MNVMMDKGGAYVFMITVLCTSCTWGSHASQLSWYGKHKIEVGEFRELCMTAEMF